jgi:hypothetical protein
MDSEAAIDWIRRLRRCSSQATTSATISATRAKHLEENPPLDLTSTKSETSPFNPERTLPPKRVKHPHHDPGQMGLESVPRIHTTPGPGMDKQHE